MNNIQRVQFATEQKATAQGLVLSVTVHPEISQKPRYIVPHNFAPNVKCMISQFGLGAQWVVDDSQRCLRFDDLSAIGVIVTGAFGDKGGQIKGFLRKVGAESHQSIVLYKPRERWTAMSVDGSIEPDESEIKDLSLNSINTLINYLLKHSKYVSETVSDQHTILSTETSANFLVRTEPGYFERWRLSLDCTSK